MMSSSQRFPRDRICPVIPSYATLDIIQEIISGKRPAPATSIGAGLASVLAAHEAVNIVLGRRDIVTAPQYTYIDLLDRKFVAGTVQ